MLISALCLGCGPRYFSVHTSEIPGELARLANRQPEYFRSPMTLLVLLDTTPCSKAFTETIWWKDWQAAAHKAGYGFVFATSTADSNDVAIAVQLEGVDAPILVLPSCPDSVLSLGIPPGYLPLKLLMDRTGHYRRAWGPLIDTTSSNELMHFVDSVSTATAHVSN